MKKMLLAFSDALLSREQMKAVKGGQLAQCCCPGAGCGYCTAYPCSTNCGDREGCFRGKY